MARSRSFPGLPDVRLCGKVGRTLSWSMGGLTRGKLGEEPEEGIEGPASGGVS
jgi:hypothetical protein